MVCGEEEDKITKEIKDLVERAEACYTGMEEFAPIYLLLRALLKLKGF